MSVIIETSIGDLTVDLYTDERPRCCLNFLKLCKVKYYNFSLFHSVQENLVAQVGDPTASGRGGESVFAQLYGEQARFFDMEVNPRIKHTKKGLISMVNNGSGMHGSQFFFTLADDLDYLDGKHTVFGEVAEGFDILEKLNKTFCDDSFRPHQDVRIYHTVLLDDPYDDPDGLEIPDASPGPTREMLESDRIPCDADVNEDEGKTEEELAEMMAEKEAKANTQILEMVGDLPDSEVAPPENVLFVCKLNPVTTSDDLEIIFSRFGQIVSCEVIKDSKTGESLQYAFIEFSDPNECENAYFKMDNVLIDDRRIHVDFSQSVSKLKWKGKGRGVEIITGGTAPAFMLKNQQRQDDRYDLVYEHDDDADAGGDNTLKKTKKNREKSKKSKKQDDSEDERDDSRQKKRKRSASPSPNNRSRQREVDEQRYDNRRRDGRGDERQRGKFDNRDGRQSGKYGDRDGRQPGKYDNRDERQRNSHDHRDNYRKDSRDRAGNDSRSRRDDRDDDYSSRRDGRGGGGDRRSRLDDREDGNRARRDDRDDYRWKREEGRSREGAEKRDDRRKHRSRSPAVKNDRARERSRSQSSEDSRAAHRNRDKKRRNDSQERSRVREGSSEEDRQRSKVKDTNRDQTKNGKSRKTEKRHQSSDSSEDSSEDEKRKSHKKDKKKKKKRKASSSDESEDERRMRRKEERDVSASSSDESVKRKKKKKKDKSRR
ncbi:peptidyl-prolyl cis-trans isomerase sig-7 [Aplysia californica]|uniref:peptidylprolyl isomerase n=1 Tax=Aplysia californica TaxID=6500 RepID=A0ABM0K7T3_APLCA|nr:peptidyl-prolyl cis-trans isomerase sig-7 [Aplysia californica]